MALNFYDISSYQGDINNGVVPGDAVGIKATEGVGYTDPDCDANYQQAKAAGKLRLVYHFARPDGNSARDEARWFYSQVIGYLGDAVMGLDLETQPISPEWVKEFDDEFYSLSKVHVVLYMSQSSFNTGDWSAIWPNNAAWVAMYGANNPQTGYGPAMAPVSINGDWVIFAWQYTSKGRLPGWSGDLDLDIAYVDADGWRRYAEGDRNAPAQAPAPTPEPAPAATPEPAPQPVVVAPEPVSTPAETTVTTPSTTIIDNLPATEASPLPPITEPASDSVFDVAPHEVHAVQPKNLWSVIIDFVLRLLRIKK